MYSVYLPHLLKIFYFSSEMSQIYDSKYITIKITSNLIIHRTTIINNFLSMLSDKCVYIHLPTHIPFKNGIILNKLLYILYNLCRLYNVMAYIFFHAIKHSYTNSYTRYKTDIKQMASHPMTTSTF